MLKALDHVRRRRQVLSTQTDNCSLFVSRTPTADVP